MPIESRTVHKLRIFARVWALLSIAFYVWEYAYSGDLAGDPFFLLVAAPGFLFLLCWRLTRRNQAQPRPA